MLVYIFCLLTMAYAVAILFPETKLGQALDRSLIKGLARHLNRMTWARAVFLIALTIGAVVFSFAAVPAELAMMAAADWALYVEVVAALTVTNITSRLSGLLAPIRAAASTALVRVATGIRRVKARQDVSRVVRRPLSSKSNEDAPEGVWDFLPA